MVKQRFATGVCKNKAKLTIFFQIFYGQMNSIFEEMVLIISIHCGNGQPTCETNFVNHFEQRFNVNVFDRTSNTQRWRNFLDTILFGRYTHHPHIRINMNFSRMQVNLVHRFQLCIMDC